MTARTAIEEARSLLDVALERLATDADHNELTVRVAQGVGGRWRWFASDANGHRGECAVTGFESRKAAIVDAEDLLMACSRRLRFVGANGNDLEL